MTMTSTGEEGEGGGGRMEAARGGLRKEGSKLPFELVGKVAGTSAVAEATHVESGTATRHLEKTRW